MVEPPQSSSDEAMTTRAPPAPSPSGHRPPKASMRRHHFLSLSDNPHPPDSISLLIGAEAEQRRRRSSPLPRRAPEREMPRRLHSLFGGVVPGETDSPTSDAAASDDEGETATQTPASPGFLNRVHSYSRLMHAHTQSQLARPGVGTLPSYQKTMHAFTLNQLASHQQQAASRPRSEQSSPHLAARLAVPGKLQVQLSKLTLDEVPPAPGNTPEAASARRMGAGVMDGIDFRKLKRRSITDPDLVRGLVSGIEVRDFAGKG